MNAKGDVDNIQTKKNQFENVTTLTDKKYNLLGIGSRYLVLVNLVEGSSPSHK